MDASLSNALALFKSGYDPALIELKEKSVFPLLIPAAPATARKSRSTGILLGRPAPKYVRRGRSVRYRLSDVLQWLEDVEAYRSTAEAFLGGNSAGK